MTELEPAAIVPLPAGEDPAPCRQPVAGEPALVRVVRALIGPVAEARVVVVVAEPFAARIREVLAAYGLPNVGVVTAPAGSDRAGAIVAGLEAVVAESDSTTPLLLHDVAHPLAPVAVAARVLAEVRAGRSFVVPAIPMTDSVKSVDEHGVVTATVDRATLLTAQYPRGFTAATLRGLATGAAPDELAAALATGTPIWTVEGHADGGRFTLPQDVPLLEAIIGSRP